MSKNYYANYEVRSPWMVVAWFIIEEDAEAFIRGLDTEGTAEYSIHEVEKIVMDEKDDY